MSTWIPAIILIASAVWVVMNVVGSDDPSPRPSGDPGGHGATTTDFAREELGKPYSQTNPQGPDHWDCSGLIQHIYRRDGIDIPRRVTEQAQQAPRQVDATQYGSIEEFKAALRPGDNLGSGRNPVTDRYKHTGRWTGYSMIHASASRGKTVEDPGLASYWFNERRTIYAY